MVTVRVYYDFSLWPKMDAKIKRIAKKFYFPTKNIGSGAGSGTRDIEFDFPTKETAEDFRNEVMHQGGVKLARLPATEPLSKGSGFMI